MSWVNKPINEKRSFTEYTVASATAEFQIGFEFKEEVNNLNITLDGKPVADLGYVVDLINDQTIKLTPTVDSGLLRIERETDIDNSIHKFTAGALFEARTMDENFEQILHSQQEVRDSQFDLEARVIPVVDGLEEALIKADEASKAAQEASEAAEEAANKVALTVQSVKDMLDIQNPRNGYRVRVISYHAVPESSAELRVGGGEFVYDPTMISKHDGGTNIKGWLRIKTAQFVDAADYGVKAYDWKFDNYEPLQNALNTNREVRLGTGRFMITKPLVMSSQQGLIGEGIGKTIIYKLTDTVSDVDTSGFTGSMATVNYAVDAVLIVLPQPSNYTQYVRVAELALQNGASYNEGKGYCLFAPYVSQSDFKNVLLNFGTTPHYTINSWMCGWEAVRTYSKGTGFIFGGRAGDTGRGGTSNELNRCWVVGSQVGYPYNFYGQMYTSMDSCGADGNGSTTTYIDGIVYSERSTIGIKALGAEDNYARRIVRNVTSRVTFDNLQVLNFHNTSGNSTSLFEVVGATARTIVNNASLEFKRFANPTDLNSPKFGDVSSGGLLRVAYAYVDQAMTGLNNGTPFEIKTDAASSAEFITQSSVLSVYGTQSTGLTTSRNVTSNQDYIIRSIQTTDKILTSATALYADVGFLNDAACRYNTAKFKMGNSSVYRDSFGRPRYKLSGNPVDQYDGIPLDGYEAATAPPAWVTRQGHGYLHTTDNTLRIFTSSGWMKLQLQPI